MSEDEFKKAELRFVGWKRRADEDEQVAEMIIEDEGPANPICFHAQQLAEKYLKGYLAFHKILPPKTHEIKSLLRLCGQIHISFEELAQSAKLLDEYYTEARYPDDIEEFSNEECGQAFRFAKDIKSFVLYRIEADQN